MLTRYLYAWAVNFNVALGSLVNVETDLFPMTAPRTIAPKALPVNRFPVEDRVQAGYFVGDGFIDLDWEMVLPDAAIDYIITTKFALTTVNYKACTIYTRKYLTSYARYNAYIHLPRPGQELIPIRGGISRVVWRFTKLAEL